MRDSTIFYRSFYEAIKELPPQNQSEVYSAIFEYSLNFTETKLTGLSKTIFTLIKPQLDANLKRFKNGSIPKDKQTGSKQEAKPKQTGSETEANNNNNVNNNNNKNLNNNENNNYAEKIIADKLIYENAYRIHKCSKPAFEKIVSSFFTIQKANGKQWKEYRECAKHFNNWLPKFTLTADIISSNIINTKKQLQ